MKLKKNKLTALFVWAAAIDRQPFESVSLRCDQRRTPGLPKRIRSHYSTKTPLVLLPGYLNKLKHNK
jgi:hypothetical protein